MKLIYVAGKYSEKTYSEIDDNIRKAEYASVKLLSLGWAVITPHKNTAHYEIYEAAEKLNYKVFMDNNFEILQRCDALFLLKDWQNSKGARMEAEHARYGNMEIYEESNGYPKP